MMLKARAYEELKNAGIIDVLLHFSNRNKFGEMRGYRQWNAWRGHTLLCEGKNLSEVVIEVIHLHQKEATA